MEESKGREFRPNPKINVIGIWIGIILSITIIGLPIGIPLLVTNIALYIKKKYSIYYVRDTEIELYYKFISKNTKVVRMNLITSVTLKRSWFQKMFGLGSVSFGIFGKSSGYDVQAAQAGGVHNTVLSQMLSDLDNFNEAFKLIRGKIGVDKNEVIYKDKPSLRPAKFYRTFFGVFTLIGFVLVSLGIYIMTVFDEEFGIVFVVPGVILLFIFLILFIAQCFDVAKIKSTKYKIFSDKLRISFNYYFGSSCIDVPIAKITNTVAGKNLIGWALFKVGNLRVMTGGNNDPYMGSLEKFELFAENLSRKYSSDVLNVKQSDESLSMKDSAGAMHVTRPRGSFFMGVFVWMSILFLIPALILIFFVDFIFLKSMGGVLIFLYFVIVLWRYILWKNTSYEFYEDRIIDKSGVINISTNEIYFKNIRYIQLTRSYFFERMMGQGSIHIYTAGTGAIDNTINSLDEFSGVYKELKQIIEDKSDLK